MRTPRSLRGSLGTLWLLSLGLVAACGARTGLFVGDGQGGTVGPCTPTPLSIVKAVPNLYFILDRSGSMKENSKWETVRSVVSNLMTTVGPAAHFGAATFPSPGGMVCSAGTEILPLTPGDVTGTAAGAFLSATMIQPNGGTPTAATITSLTPELSAFPGVTYAILATDGGANCDANITCGLDTCTANLDNVAAQCQPFVAPSCCGPMGPAGPIDCLDTQATVDAVTMLAAANVKTFVIGILGSAPYQQMLGQLAMAGGTARAAAPYYYSVDTADAQALADVLADIAARITASCNLTLAGVPSEPNTLIVSLGGATVPNDPTNGWQLSGKTLTLAGTACTELLAGQKEGLAISEGCGGPQ